ncbi:MAG TPA: prepilin-type N-terminal cleavage/methylation domain-containing protein [Stellaceae bacterium]|nr:prepilin-type N-terminal cleavage/methylation domain-containing protein [Stellaceae bacterium]
MTKPGKRKARPGHSAGFTLVELLVALALSALVSLILLHGIRIAAAGFERHTREADRLDARQSLDDLLRRTLGAAATIPQTAGGMFRGGPDALVFLAAAEDGGAGLYRVELALDRARAEPALVLRRQLAVPAGDPRIAASVIADRVRDFRLAYFGADAASAAAAWHDSWQQLNLLPLLVRVTLDRAGAPPRPALVVRLWSAG